MNLNTIHQKVNSNEYNENTNINKIEKKIKGMLDKDVIISKKRNRGILSDVTSIQNINISQGIGKKRQLLSKKSDLNIENNCHSLKKAKITNDGKYNNSNISSRFEKVLFNKNTHTQNKDIDTFLLTTNTVTKNEEEEIEEEIESNDKENNSSERDIRSFSQLKLNDKKEINSEETKKRGKSIFEGHNLDHEELKNSEEDNVIEVKEDVVEEKEEEEEEEEIKKIVDEIKEKNVEVDEVDEENEKEITILKKLIGIEEEEEEEEEEETTKDNVRIFEDKDWEDLDIEDEFDPIMVSEYVVEVFEYLRKLEISTKPNPNYIEEVNNKLTWKMRTSLIDWIIQLHYAFKFCPETLYLTINIIDRFLSRRAVSSSNLPLIGIASFFIAAKFEEIVVPSIEQILKAANKCNTPDEVFTAERYILKELSFDMNFPSPMNFLRRISKADNYEMFARTLSKFFMEMTLINHQFLKYTPSLISAASMHLSRIMLDRTEWTPNLRHYSGYHEDELKECISLLIKSIIAQPKKWNRSVLDKYALPKFGKVSLFARQWIQKNIETAEKLANI